jgi:hypothetical protein
MPDLREDLERLADFVGEPRTFVDLERSRRRRERRRRTEGLVVGLAVSVVAALFLVSTFDGQPVVTPQGTADALPTSTPTVWPESVINGDAAARVQAAVDSGDGTLQWRTDPKEVVFRFARRILGRSVALTNIATEPGQWKASMIPCPAGFLQGNASCGGPAGGLQIDLVQPETPGDGGIWSVAAVTSDQLDVSIDAPAGEPVAEGTDVTFGAPGLDASQTAHFRIVGSNGCNILNAADDLTSNGERTLQVPKLYQASPSCVASAGGYAIAYVTDDATLAPPDPIAEPTAIEPPWITVVPFAIDWDREIITPTPSAVAGGSDPSASGPTDSPSGSEPTTGPSGSEPTNSPSGIEIPVAIESASSQSCSSIPATEFDIFFRGVQLVGCGRWTAGTTLTMYFESAESDVASGLMLFSTGQCSQQLCSGDPLWQVPVEVHPSARTFHLGPLDPGAYILLDPVHPTTTAIAIDVS